VSSVVPSRPVRFPVAWFLAQTRARKTILFHARNYPRFMRSSQVLGCCVECKQALISNDIRGCRYDVDFAINAKLSSATASLFSVYVRISGRRSEWNKSTVYKYKTNTVCHIAGSLVNSSKVSKTSHLTFTDMSSHTLVLVVRLISF